ncbi:MAG: nucleotide exchange factor GrpE [Candidatus Andersenbacteria bacterium]|nr:nucleotide exchange factor GrpE [Candidatus Andersenbacteria bacterium]MBI3250437.1 nucleotide exchange factor GrpE [Candidatus Andersenbacteria bacterium]
MSIYSSQLHGKASTQEREYLAGWQRARAELKNLRKRLSDEGMSQQQRFKAQVLEPLLQVADNFNALIAHAPTGKEADNWSKGVLHIARDFERVLAEFGLEPITANKEPFNPLFHEAVGQAEEEGSMVVEVLQTGWKMGDRVLRPAKVRVGK